MIYLFTHKNLSPKLLRIRLDLEDYDFIIEHISGKSNVVADALSRIHIKDIIDLCGKTTSVLTITRSKSKKMLASEKKSTKPVEKENDYKFVPIIESTNSKIDKKLPKMKCTLNSINGINKGVELIIKVYKGHEKKFEIKVDMASLTDDTAFESALSILETTAIKHKFFKMQLSLADTLFCHITIQSFKNICNKIFKTLQLILLRRRVPIKERAKQLELLKFFHEDKIFGGHCGQKKLYSNISSQYSWKRMRQDIAKFVKNCPKCQLTKVNVKNKVPMTITLTPQKVFDTIVIDTIGPLQIYNFGNRYATTMECDLSKYILTIPIPNKEANTIAKAIFKDFILIYGLIKRILTDLGTEYINKIIKKLCTLLQITHDTSTAYHHQTVGTAERSHRTFNEYIRSYLSNMSDWEEYSRYFDFCYNISHHSAFYNKYSPYELVFNKNPILPIDWLNGQVDPIYNFDDFVYEAKFRLQNAHQDANNLLKKLKMRNKEYYDSNAKPLNLNVHDTVKLVVEPYDKLQA